MKKRTIVAVAAVLACTAGAAYAATFTWNGSGGSSWFNASWTIVGIPAQQYPSISSDDAFIVYDAGQYPTPYTINAGAVTIDDFTITTNVDLVSSSGTPTVTVDTLTISGPAIVTLSDGVSIDG